ncbi:carotenoid ester lipase precursor [Athelia psychrophila]|uniref:Carboxylic ester hydrolase n=1 Tax=Athelia psychrophila TaxID=1759441 RepID=A0A167U8E3_9AGAM|nr:carotenoid ester lipase precursor [Fibularhizoctonia sp. CBS 109695]
MVSTGSKMRSLLFASSLLSIAFASASPHTSRGVPGNASSTVKLDSAIVTGVAVQLGPNSSVIEQYLGIPFAQAPTGNLRYRLPVTVQPYTTSFNATTYGPYCLQIPFVVPNFTLSNVTTAQSEDCLSINIIRPAGYESAKLPVLTYIFGGGFDAGGGSEYDGSVIVQKSIDIGLPVMYVSFNHRVAGFGFLAGQQITDAGVANLGLQDQRQALRWVQKYISSFGGDPAKVTLFGLSSGAISTALQMLLNGGDNEGLFRAAWSMSGGPLPVGSYTHGQKWYDSAVAATNCTNTTDTLACLRAAPVDALQAYFLTTPSQESYQAFQSPWLPRVDGIFLKDTPQNLVLQGSVARIPFISGDCDDEGTLFSLYQSNLTTDADFEGYIHKYYFPNATTAEVGKILELYPSDPSSGSPFGTGLNNSIYPQYKRLAAFQGDFAFQGPRRLLLQHRASLQHAWSYVDKRDKTGSYLGSFHTLDATTSMYGSGNGTELQDYIINFAHTLDPNGPTVPEWRRYTATEPTLLTLLDGTPAIGVIDDTYRAAAIEGVTAIGLKYPI